MNIIPLCTVDDVLTYPGMSSTGTDDQEWVLTLIRGFSRRAETYTDREFYTESRTRTFHGDGLRRYIQLPAFGLSTNSITSVTEDSQRAFTGSAVDATAYDFDWETGLLFRDSTGWLDGRNVIQVVWTGGIGTDTEDVPDDLRTSAIMQVAFWWQRRNELGLTSRAFQGGTINVNLPSTLLPEVVDVLESYKLL